MDLRFVNFVDVQMKSSFASLAAPNHALAQPVSHGLEVIAQVEEVGAHLVKRHHHQVDHAVVGGSGWNC